MSAQLTAQQLAAYGRGPDSTLVHMAPHEVAGLQALAQAHGGSLSINPETGLPEAGFLSSILPMVAGAALTGISGGVINPLTASMIVGGGTALATGSLQRGLMAGLGAYGGAGIGAGLSSMGASALAAEAPATIAAEAAMNATPYAFAEGLAPEIVGEATAGAVGNYANAFTGAQSAVGPWDAISRGAAEAFKNPSALANNLGGLGQTAKYGLAALSPILADQSVQANMPQTTTKPGMIRPYTFSRAPTESPKAPSRDLPYTSERRWFDDRYTAGVPYEAGTQAYATGGIAGLAQGGVSDAVVDPYTGAETFADGGVPSAAPWSATLADLARVAREGTGAQKADWYSAMRGQGAADTTIRSLVEQNVGRQTDGDWRELQRLAAPSQRPVEQNPFFTMNGQSADAFRYLMGQQPQSQPQPVNALPVPQTTKPVQTPDLTTPTSRPGYEGLPQYTWDPVTRRMVQTYVPAANPVQTTTQAPGSGEEVIYGGPGAFAEGGIASLADGRLLRGGGDGVSDSIPAQIDGAQGQRPARLADGEFVVPARIVSELGNGSTDAGARRLYAMMDRVQAARKGTMGQNFAVDSGAHAALPA